MKRASIFISVVAFVGCTPSYVQPLLPSDHPANPGATQASFVTPADVLTTSATDTVDGMADIAGMNRTGMPGMNHEGMAGMNRNGMPGMNHEGMAGMNRNGMPGMNHEGMANATPMKPQDVSMAPFPDSAKEPLKQLLGAFSVIGDRIASNSIEGVAEQAQLIGRALDALVKVEFNADPLFWKERESDIRAIRGMVLTLVENSDLNVAHTAYTILSDALERVIAATSVPGGHTRPEEQKHLEHDRNPGGQQ